MGRPGYILALLCAIVTLGALTACSESEEEAPVVDPSVPMSIVVTSAVVSDGEALPGKHTCYGLDQSPPISWTGVPEGTKSLALTLVQPDVKVHWVLYALPPDVSELPEGMTAAEATSLGGKNVSNDFNRLGYGGPCSPRGEENDYVLTVYAVDTELDLGSKPDMNDLLTAMSGHLLARGQLKFTYLQRDIGIAPATRRDVPTAELPVDRGT